MNKNLKLTLIASAVITVFYAAQGNLLAKHIESGLAAGTLLAYNPQVNPNYNPRYNPNVSYKYNPMAGNPNVQTNPQANYKYNPMAGNPNASVSPNYNVNYNPNN